MSGGSIISTTKLPLAFGLELIPNLSVRLIDTCGWGDTTGNDKINAKELALLFKKI